MPATLRGGEWAWIQAEGADGGSAGRPRGQEGHCKGIASRLGSKDIRSSVQRNGLTDHRRCGLRWEEGPEGYDRS